MTQRATGRKPLSQELSEVFLTFMSPILNPCVRSSRISGRTRAGSCCSWARSWVIRGSETRRSRSPGSSRICPLRLAPGDQHRLSFTGGSGVRQWVRYSPQTYSLPDRRLLFTPGVMVTSMPWQLASSGLALGAQAPAVPIGPDQQHENCSSPPQCAGQQDSRDGAGQDADDRRDGERCCHRVPFRALF